MKPLLKEQFKLFGPGYWAAKKMIRRKKGYPYHYSIIKGLLGNTVPLLAQVMRQSHGNTATRELKVTRKARRR